MDDIAVERRVVLGLQHTVAMFGATILVPLIVGWSPSIALLSAGVGTLLFHLVTKGIVPVFLGSSFAFIAPILLAQAEGYSFLSIGVGIVGAGVVYLIVSFLVTVIPDGTHKIRALFPPVVTGPIIAVIGITLAPVAINQAKDNWWLALVTLGAVIVASIWFRGLFKLLPILSGFIVGYVVAIVFGQVEFAALNESKWLAWPDFGGVFGGGEFEIGAVWLIAPVALVTMIEHVGDILTNGRVVGKDFFDNPGVNRTLMGDGLATLLAGLLGGPPNTTYSENTGVLAVTKVYDPRVLRIGALFAILLGFIPKFGGLLQTVPVPVLGGLSMVLFGMIASIGMRVLTDARVDFTQSRNLIVAALILVIGLGFGAFDQVTTLLGTTWDGLPTIGDVKVSGLALAALAGVIANLILPKAIDEPEYEEAAVKAA
jgi:uracil permease